MRSGVFLKTAALSIFLIASRNFVFALEEENTFKIITEASQSVEQNLLEESVMLENIEPKSQVVVEEVLQEPIVENLETVVEDIATVEVQESSTKVLTEEILQKQIVETVDPILNQSETIPVMNITEVVEPQVSKQIERPIARNQQLTRSGAIANNMDTFEGATTLRCEEGSSCQSCTSKKRAHSGISGITFAITIAAIIGAALIISSAGNAASPTP